MKHFVRLIKAATKKADAVKLDHWFAHQCNEIFPPVGSTKIYTANAFQTALRLFNHQHQWHHDHLHPCFPLFLGIVQHIDALSSKSSPFPLMGLVHTKNEITQPAPLANQDITSQCYFDAIRPHARGVMVDLVIEFRQQNRLCQTTRSTYLYRRTPDRTQGLADGDSPAADTLSNKTYNKSEHLHFQENAGRKYARISGDYNPIHLYDWSARLFGFKSVMAHGTHVLARTLSVVDKNQALPGAGFTVSNQFHRPVSLPSDLTVTFNVVTNSDTARRGFALYNPATAKRKQQVMSGCVIS